jgi:hypothetical protein
MRARAFAGDIGLRLARSECPSEDQVPYSEEALKQDLLRVRIAWEDCQASRSRD